MVWSVQLLYVQGEGGMWLDAGRGKIMHRHCCIELELELHYLFSRKYMYVPTWVGSDEI